MSLIQRPGRAKAPVNYAPGGLLTICCALAAALAASPAAGESSATATSPAAQNRRCYQCHAQPHIGQLSPKERAVMVAPAATSAPAAQADRPASRPGLHLSETDLERSVHGDLACVHCHPAAQKLPHKASLGPPTCSTSTCHVEEQETFNRSAHALAAAKGNREAPNCVSCHGGHAILSRDKRASMTYPLNVVKTCGNCHRKHDGGAATLGKAGNVTSYLDGTHGRALVKSGLVVAATCASCHGHHAILPSSDPNSTVNRRNVPQTCGQCHVGLAETYAQSIHGRKLAEGNLSAPTCTGCHTAHAISRTNIPQFKLDIVNECGQCHDKPGASGRGLYDTYRLSYHGQANALGLARGARCSDCHGSHDIQPVDNPESILFRERRVETCRKCHPNATPQFAQFVAHADYRDARQYPLFHAVWLYFMIMMSCAFGFFGLHALLWLIRLVIDRVRNGPRPRPSHDGPTILRFTRAQRISHALMATSFFALTLTGLPLLYADKGWAISLMGGLGGVRTAGLLHRGFALLLLSLLTVHILGLVGKCRKHSARQVLFGPTTMLPRFKDVRDCAGMFRWFFRGGPMPRLDHWTYWEKFDYMAEVGGTTIIGLSGLMLWFPELFGRFLPGWAFNVASIVHGYEALLAIVFIFTIHFFNANLRPDKFPVDAVIFTGKITEQELEHERPVEYERLKAAGELERLRVKPPKAWWRKVAAVLGLAAMAVGLALAVLIVLAGLGTL